MTLLTTVQAVCAAVGVERPASVFSNINNNRTMQEMLALANEMAQRIAYDAGHDWQVLKNRGEFVGGFHSGIDDGVSFYDFPEKFKRFLLTSNIWRSTSTLYPMRFVPDADQWLQRRAAGYYDARGEWTTMGGAVWIAPPLNAASASAPAQKATYAYLDKNCIRPYSVPHGETDRFTNDGDTTWIDERLLKLGMIWQWKANKGSPYAEDMASYNDALALAMGKDSPAPIIIGRMPISAAVQTAYPFPIDPGMTPL
jgi:hypothetical protein